MSVIEYKNAKYFVALNEFNKSHLHGNSVKIRFTQP